MENKIEAAVELVESNEWQEIEETLRRVEVPSVLSSSPEQVTFQQPPVSSCFDTSNSPSCSSLVSISLEAELQSRDEFAVRIQTAVSSRAQSCRLGSSSVMTSSPIVDSNILTLFTTHFPSARFDASRAVWLFPVSEHNRLKLLLQTLPHVRFTSLPDWVLRVFDNSSRSSSNNSPLKSLDHISSRLLKALLPFQREGLEYAIRRGGRVLFADEMGLGKTLQALATILYWRNEWPVLIIVPSSLRLQWADQVQQWIPDIAPTDINIVMNSKCNVNALINIISYDLVPKLLDKIKAKHFKVVVADESHFLKNNRTKRTQAVLPLLKSARRAILLTGTPAVSRPVELFPQIQSLRPDLFHVFTPFGLRYCNGHLDRFGWNFTGASHLRELYVLLSETVMIRRLKKNVLTQLPPKRRQKVCISIAAKCKALISKINRELKEIRHSLRNENLSESQARDLRFHRRRVLLELYHDTGTAKLLSVVEYLKDLLESGEKFLVFAHHQDVLDGLCHALYQQHVDHVRIDGRTPGPIRHDLVTHFQTHDACKVAVLSMTAAGVGLTFTKASTVIFAELFWNPVESITKTEVDAAL
jgi:SWI/SNF-related matrix-associated actin-dependent regulator 1 of chromatin subfamily A